MQTELERHKHIIRELIRVFVVNRDHKSDITTPISEAMKLLDEARELIKIQPL